MRAFIILVILTISATGVFSSVFDIPEEHKEKLRTIRNACVVESDLSPYEIGIAKRAIGPAKKLVRASHCVVQRLTELQDDEIVKEIVERTKQVVRNLSMSKINKAVEVCKNLLGKDVCDKVVQLAGLVVENVKNAQFTQA